MNRLAEKLRLASYSTAVKVGLIGSIIVTLCSHTVGAIRARGGIMQALGLDALTFGHLSGIFVILLWIGILLMAASWIMVGGHILRHGASLARSAIAAWIGPLAFAGPLMSRDLYSYLMQGTLARDGIDAYQHGAAANPGPLLFEVSADWRNTTTPYGPLHLGLGKAITTVTGDNITAGTLVFKALSIGSVLVMAWAVWRLAPHCGVRSDVAVWLGVFNPLSVIHLIGGMHNENLMMALVLTALVAAIELRPLPGGFLAVALVAVGGSLKATAFIALPFIVWIMVCRIAGRLPVTHSSAIATPVWRETLPRFFTLIWTGIASVVLTVGVVWAVTVLSGQTSGWISELTGNSKVINPLALPTFIASTLDPVVSRIDDSITFNSLVSAFRPWSTLAMGIGLVVSWWLFRANERAAIKGMTVAYLVTCVFNTVTLPWYYAAPLALMGLWLTNRNVIFFTSVFCMWLAVMFDGGGNNRLYVLWWVVLGAAVMWWLTQNALGYRPGLATEKTDEWDILAGPDSHARTKSAPSPAPAA
ncbi:MULTISPECIES: alpha-(1-_6)-mannopyranosyltransferase A [Corynebacterium]|uniref:Alpha-(1->6)-mannopyranosyltransferase A n=1 Tax=Corynebacterium auriscanis TaxID=99807 RepID=A0A0A2DJ10_9CORY|nr:MULTISPECIES: alpha-(1->6)-mannopyranosyltransferase A [Corynebacterium]KGM19200.1 alpha 1,6 mannopyranosyltransferase [Corynebacterium auriscanis]OFT88443.1 alpha 1,6 mannopyranosyltransferase [Corynebacterium sp. HMSC28B08]WJY72463.1 hypothetical protein CAURIC_04070 [Corynebacterium auriscanis]